jgi:hypothetical protein
VALIFVTCDKHCGSSPKHRHDVWHSKFVTRDCMADGIRCIVGGARCETMRMILQQRTRSTIEELLACDEIVTCDSRVWRAKVPQRRMARSSRGLRLSGFWDM